MVNPCLLSKQTGEFVRHPVWCPELSEGMVLNTLELDLFLFSAKQPKVLPPSWQGLPLAAW